MTTTSTARPRTRKPQTTIPNGDGSNVDATTKGGDGSGDGTSAPDTQSDGSGTAQ